MTSDSGTAKIPPSEVREGRIRPRMADGEKVGQFLMRLPRRLREQLEKQKTSENRPMVEITRDALVILLKNPDIVPPFVAQDGDVHDDFLVRLPESLNERLRDHAFKVRQSKGAVTRSALSHYLGN